MRIFILPTSYPNEKYPQKDIFIYEQAKKLASFGHEIIVLHVEKLPTRSLFSRNSNKIEVKDDGFAIRFTKKQKTIMEDQFPILNRNAFVDNMEQLFFRASEQIGMPDVLYAHFSCWAGYAGTIISKKYDIPLVTLEHFGGLLGHEVKKTLISGVKFVRKNSNVFMCVSEGLKNSIIKFDEENKEDIIVIPNMVDDSFRYVPRKDNDCFTFCSIGNLNKGKDFENLIIAFCRAFSKSDDVCLRIGGDGPEREHLLSLIKENGREKQILLLGRLTRKQTIEEYVNCDCFTLASRFETYGIVYREALVTGRPIITTNHGGFSDQDWHECYGVKTEVGDVEGLSSALKDIHRNIHSYNGEFISELCLKDCSPQFVGRKIENILFNAIKRQV